MKTAVTTLALWALVGCSGVPPKPPKCIGEFRPINQVSQQAANAEKGDTNLCALGGEHGNHG
jgi:hypothetical protein